MSFDASGSIDPDGDPLTFSWDFGEGPLVTAGATARRTYTTNGPHFAQLTASDPNGGTELTTITIIVGNPPSSAIVSPEKGTAFNAGDIINYSGLGSDIEDGLLPASAFSWSVFLHHGKETDPNHHVRVYKRKLTAGEVQALAGKTIK